MRDAQDDLRRRNKRPPSAGRFGGPIVLIREAIEMRLSEPSIAEDEVVRVRLPRTLKRDRTDVRVAMMQRLAASRLFALGDRTGVLKAAARRSGRAFRLDVRQRVIVKALVSKHMGRGADRGAALAKHLAYLGRSGAGEAGARPDIFDRDADQVEAGALVRNWSGDRHHFRFIISPEHGDRIADLRGYVRDVMTRVADDLGEPRLTWLATCHYDTDQPHAHVLVRGRSEDGRDLVIPRTYMGYGFRARAQEAAQERLGDLSRADAERRVWKETQADRFTGLDRRLLAAAGPDGLVEDGVGHNSAWAALTRGRLRHLEGLGLAVREGRLCRLDQGLEGALRGLQIRRDIIRTLNQRRLEVGGEVRMIGAGRVRGAVVSAGFHDEVGAAPWVIVREPNGLEVFARLAPGRTPAIGAEVALQSGAGGLAVVIQAGRGMARD